MRRSEYIQNLVRLMVTNKSAPMPYMPPTCPRCGSEVGEAPPPPGVVAQCPACTAIFRPDRSSWDPVRIAVEVAKHLEEVVPFEPERPSEGERTDVALLMELPGLLDQFAKSIEALERRCDVIENGSGMCGNAANVHGHKCTRERGHAGYHSTDGNVATWLD